MATDIDKSIAESLNILPMTTGAAYEENQQQLAAASAAGGNQKDQKDTKDQKEAGGGRRGPRDREPRGGNRSRDQNESKDQPEPPQQPPPNPPPQQQPPTQFEDQKSGKSGKSSDTERTENVDKLAALNENFFYNTMLGRALLSLVPYKDRTTVKLWLDKLADMDHNEEELTLRHEYMWFLLLMMESRKIRQPFNKMPPRDLVPLKDSVPRNVYEEILLWSDQSMISLDTISKRRDGDGDADGDGEGDGDGEFGADGHSRKHVSPAKFLHHQPKPRDGIICYMAAFSDRDKY